MYSPYLKDKYFVDAPKRDWTEYQTTVNARVVPPSIYRSSHGTCTDLEKRASNFDRIKVLGYRRMMND